MLLSIEPENKVSLFFEYAKIRTVAVCPVMVCTMDFVFG